MTITLPTLPGLTSSAVHNIPASWDATWYRRHIRDFLQWADVRNSTSGAGIKVSGNLTGPATISLDGIGTGNTTFQSGDVLFWQASGAGGLKTADHLGHSNSLIFGTNIPLPSGVNGRALLIGSGGGGGVPIEAWIIQDQAFDASTPGNTLGITAGETQGSGTANGGLLWLLGGASFGGIGGELRLQGGTSATGQGGPVNIFGGNSTGSAAPGDVFVVAGQAGNVGANVHLIMTTLSGVPGSVRIRNNSTILYQFLNTGAIFIGATGAGLPGQPLVSGGPGASTSWQTGFTGTITTAKLTAGGSNGSMTFSSGILISQVQAT